MDASLQPTIPALAACCANHVTRLLAVNTQCAVDHCTTYATNKCTCTTCDAGFKLAGGSCVAVSAVAGWDGQGMGC